MTAYVTSLVLNLVLGEHCTSALLFSFLLLVFIMLMRSSGQGATNVTLCLSCAFILLLFLICYCGHTISMLPTLGFVPRFFPHVQFIWGKGHCVGMSG